ncbi:ribonuclease H-like domain-containing protein [Bacillus sp. FJAT-49736]|uniref:ribonuclease H-like domain-containing protein n=1 Tax=Bacillus sp. FJAT-49736 TaxID=2833582 RepID=UPI001BC8CC10|nr:ribonuclease H-like domain-containing protein [Bacillus sp. FJAT-49736]MBS4173233.1 ribonuclease H-like domain-containing protein [Bacillus sp. FJAT-49736]
MSLMKKLNRMKQHIVREEKDNSSIIPIQMNQEKIVDSTIPYLPVWESADTFPYYKDKEYCLIREIRFPLDHYHGKYPFRDFLKAVDLWNRYDGKHPLSAKGFQPSELFFFDTETTGLGGGTGNTIFILGYASFTDNEVILKQHFLTEPGMEVPLYYSFLENINYKTLVTYNGKAFDWPQVKTRHTLIRDHLPKLPAFGHFDLYHASRRMWKSKMESVKLVNVEKDILQFERKDDIPGYLAPMIYFDYVERKNPEGVIEILKHNENDILSLITLYTHLTMQILQVDPMQTNEEKLLIGKWFDYIGEEKIAFDTYSHIAEGNNMEAKYELAYKLKRRKEYEKAKLLWEEAALSGERSIQKQSYIELAKLMEHQYRNYRQAQEYVLRAISLHELSDSSSSDKFLMEANKRLFRLNKK